MIRVSTPRASAGTCRSPACSKGFCTLLRIGDPRRGAGIIVRLATDPAFAETTGGYFSVKDAAPLPCPEPARSNRIQADLWETTAFLLDRVVFSAG